MDPQTYIEPPPMIACSHKNSRQIAWSRMVQKEQGETPGSNCLPFLVCSVSVIPPSESTNQACWMTRVIFVE